MSTGISWTDETWNPAVGCTHVSAGCDHCYAATLASGRLKHTPAYTGLAEGGKFNGQVRLLPDRLDQPIRWTRPRMIFVNSMSDLFHDSIPDAYIAHVFAVMAVADRHRFQVLTKRHARMRSLLNSSAFVEQVYDKLAVRALVERPPGHPPSTEVPPWPLPSVWLGVSVEDQRWADIRIPALLETPAAVRFVSAEPLLGPVDLGIGDPHAGHESDDVNGHPHPRTCLTCSTDDHDVDYFRREPGGGGIDWVICGGESGPGARPMHPGWARGIRDQCVSAGVPFFMKQAGSVLAREWGCTGTGHDPAEWPEPFPQEFP